ncbi:MAG TPA: FeoC-like transcriptional regulator [Anaerolineae bacterium]|nr:FeoC-like transcriptional regulator [Anaerolineae bacterium]
MLFKLLRVVHSMSAHSLKELAQQMDVSQELIESMIEGLARLGYLRPLAAKCGDECSHCPVGDTCAIGGLGRVWVLTESGQRIAQADAG